MPFPGKESKPIVSEYGHGTQAPIREYVEPVIRKPVWIDRPTLLKRFKWSDADFDAAQLFANFPAAAKRSLGPGAIGWTLVWRDMELDAWRERMQAAIAQMRSLVER